MAKRYRAWNPDTDPEEELWVCVSCGAEVHVDSVGDTCPACGEPKTDDGIEKQKDDKEIL